ncbi:MAG: hypothetical protein IAE91_00445 [Ignavibacteriaceae bacterium]|nr:hypothetical protein [Ignavibacteriaceae bacterium]
MKFLITFMLFSNLILPSIIPGIDTATVSYIRKIFYEGVENEDKAKELNKIISKNYKENVINSNYFLLGYLGASETLLAKHSGNPFTKIDYLQSGLAKIASALVLAPNSLEIRFMRFSILHHLPFFLGYGTEREEDQKVIYDLLLKKNYSELSKSVQKGIVEFMIESDRLNKNQVAQLKSLHAELAKL